MKTKNKTVLKIDRKIKETEAKSVFLTQYTWSVTFLAWYRQFHKK